LKATLGDVFFVKSVENDRQSSSLLDSLAVHLYNSARISIVAKWLEVKLIRLIGRIYTGYWKIQNAHSHQEFI
jgi:hypothetical protein